MKIMISKEIVINRERVIVNFDERISSVAEWLIEYITKISATDKIDDGYLIHMGWSTLALRRNDDGVLVVCEPDFLKNPFEDWRDSVNTSLLIQSQQVSLAKDLNVTPLITSFQDKIVIRKGCFDFSELYMIRSEPDKDNLDSGWYISSRELEGTEEQADSSAYEAICAFELIQARPILLECLGLPIGYFVTSEIDQIQSIYDTDNELVG